MLLYQGEEISEEELQRQQEELFRKARERLADEEAAGTAPKPAAAAAAEETKGEFSLAVSRGPFLTGRDCGAGEDAPRCGAAPQTWGGSLFLLPPSLLSLMFYHFTFVFYRTHQRTGTETAAAPNARINPSFSAWDLARWGCLFVLSGYF
jgi:hypothetical protein